MKSLELKVDITGLSPDEVFAKLREHADTIGGTAREAVLKQLEVMEAQCKGMTPQQLSGMTLLQGITGQMEELNTIHDGVVGLAQNMEEPEHRQLFEMGGAAQALGQARWTLSMASFLLKRALGLPLDADEAGDTEGEA